MLRYWQENEIRFFFYAAIQDYLHARKFVWVDSLESYLHIVFYYGNLELVRRILDLLTQVDPLFLFLQIILSLKIRIEPHLLPKRIFKSSENFIEVFDLIIGQLPPSVTQKLFVNFMNNGIQISVIWYAVSIDGLQEHYEVIQTNLRLIIEIFQCFQDDALL